MSPTPAVSIRAAREGFRRAGIAHSKHVRVHPAGTFTAEQLAQIEACPMLEVLRMAEPVATPPIAPPPRAREKLRKRRTAKVET